MDSVTDLPRRVRSAMLANPLPVGLDTDAMREKVRAALIKPTYAVGDLYHDEGVFSEIARHSVFEKVTLAVIALNALWIWIDTDHNTAAVFTQAEPPFQVVEYSFCVYFALEWTIRFKAFKWKRHCFRDGWFLF